MVTATGILTHIANLIISSLACRVALTFAKIKPGKKVLP
jgi:hypothetical protein